MISDDELLLYYYRDGLDAGERARIGAALTTQPELARRLHALVAKLDAAAAMPEVPVPPAAQQRWQDALRRAEASRLAEPAPATRRAWSPPRWQLAAVLAVAVLSMTIYFTIPRQPVPESVPVAAVPASAYEQGLKWHLASTERQIASLGEATPEERARLIEAILGQNRLYALAAERAGEPQLARVLRAFTPLLEGAARGEPESTDADLEQLSFELRVMRARLGAEPRPASNIL